MVKLQDEYESYIFIADMHSITIPQDPKKLRDNIRKLLALYLACGVDLVSVGIDQKQHVELARDIAIRFNNKYGETFKVSEPLISRVGTKILDLADPYHKMSKSSSNETPTSQVGSAVVNAVRVALRSGPSTNDSILVRVDKGERV